MSMRFTNKKRTLCEVLREINDYHQVNHKHDNRIRALCAEAELMAKKMSMKLFEYSKEYDKDWWAANPLYRDKLIKRLSDNYHFEISKEMEKDIMVDNNKEIITDNEKNIMVDNDKIEINARMESKQS